ncbi:MAG: TIGR00282 family metallophosphoesterase [Gammaproteobacteria bacterium]|nr:TIGR00282 family metallophosphoesterase [Gammaproteobacteria bacterium]NKB65393.1 TIGR00282 family metallophosphoesterase [Gammaproteobacteria bacterium]
MNILIVGDVVARPGRAVLEEQLARIQHEHDIDATIVNVENSAAGFGVTKKLVDQFMNMNIDIMTSGNHIWDKREALDFIGDYPRLLRPHNYPSGTPGSGWGEFTTKSGIRVGVLNMMGQAFMHPPLDSPFECADRVLSEKLDTIDVVVVDYHAETTSEKVGMGWYLDGKVSVVVGTHTHIPTADERLLHKGTAYVTDLGMTGCYDSVIGSDTGNVLKRMVSKLPVRLEPATGKGTLCGVVVDVDEKTGCARSIKRIKAEQDPLG